MRESCQSGPRHSVEKMASLHGVEKVGKGWAKQSEALEYLEIETDSLASFSFFMRFADLWRYSPTGSLLGVDVSAMVSVIKLELSGRNRRKRLLRDVMSIAAGIKEAAAEQRGSS